jgi:hypothetical protein
LFDPVYTAVLRMKRIFQYAAVAVMGMVALQPALAGVLCTAPAGPCPMAITDTGPSCGMPSQPEGNGSGASAQVRVTTRSSASVALPATRKDIALAAAETPGEILPLPSAAPFVGVPAPGRANSPPIYLLDRVFRI